MRTIRIILLISGVFTALLSQAQYHLDSSSTWTYYTTYWDGPNGTFYKHRTAYINGDSSIQGQTYFKRYLIGVDSVYNVNGTWTVTPYPKTLTLIRDDANHFYQYQNGVEVIIANFAKMVGDTVDPYPQGVCVDTIANVDTVYLGTQPLRRWNIGGISSSAVVEGVGSMKLSMEMECPITGQPVPVLVCYSKQGNDLLLNGGGTCALYLSNKKIENKALDVQVFPNPFADQTKLTLPDGGLFSVRLYTVNGILLATYEQEGIVDLDLKDYPDGLYLLKISNEQRSTLQKIIKK